MRIVPMAVLAIALLGGDVWAQSDSKAEQRHGSDVAHSGDFDYLLGDWQFDAESAQWGRFSGRWSAVRVKVGGVVHVLDEYRIVGDSGETYFASLTLRSYNAHRARWELVSAGDGSGLQDTGTARRVGDEMHIWQTFGADGPRPELWRIRYYDIRADRFSWSADRSLDGGETWEANHMRIEARRIGPARELAPLVSAPVVSRCIDAGAVYVHPRVSPRTYLALR